MEQDKYKKYKYTVEGQPGFTLAEALSCWKSLFEGEFVQFKRRVITHSSMDEFGQFVEGLWDTVEPLSTSTAFQEKNLERRRVFFRCIGVKAIFKNLKPELMDRQVLKLQNNRWDEENQHYVDAIEDVYELYKIDGKEILPPEGGLNNSWRREQSTVFAVRCWCTTTNREYWIYVPRNIAEKNDALEAIAWTVQLNITHPKRIFRQGDILIAERSDESADVPLYHLDKKTYTELLVSET
jgi:hypothetical protein